MVRVGVVGGGAEKNGRRRQSKSSTHLTPRLLYLPLSSLPNRYEYPFERFQEVATGYVAFLRDFAARHNGWTVTGAGIYFVERIPEKPHGWFSMKGKGFEHRGLSFNMVSYWFLVLDSLVNSLFCPSHFHELEDIITNSLDPI